MITGPAGFVGALTWVSDTSTLAGRWEAVSTGHEAGAGKEILQPAPGKQQS
jgi:hypothetical protein